MTADLDTIHADNVAILAMLTSINTMLKQQMNTGGYSFTVDQSKIL